MTAELHKDNKLLEMVMQNFSKFNIRIWKSAFNGLYFFNGISKDVNLNFLRINLY